MGDTAESETTVTVEQETETPAEPAEETPIANAIIGAEVLRQAAEETDHAEAAREQATEAATVAVEAATIAASQTMEQEEWRNQLESRITEQESRIGSIMSQLESLTPKASQSSFEQTTTETVEVQTEDSTLGIPPALSGNQSERRKPIFRRRR